MATKHPASAMDLGTNSNKRTKTEHTTSKSTQQEQKTSTALTSTKDGSYSAKGKGKLATGPDNLFKATLSDDAKHSDAVTATIFSGDTPNVATGNHQPKDSMLNNSVADPLAHGGAALNIEAIMTHDAVLNSTSPHCIASGSVGTTPNSVAPGSKSASGTGISLRQAIAIRPPKPIQPVKTEPASAIKKFLLLDSITPTTKDAESGHRFSATMITSRDAMPEVRALLDAEVPKASNNNNNNPYAPSITTAARVLKDEKLHSGSDLVVSLSQAIQHPTKYSNSKYLLWGRVVHVHGISEAAKTLDKPPPSGFTLADITASAHCVSFKDNLPSIIAVGQFVYIGRFRIRPAYMKTITSAFINDHLASHDKEVHVTESTIKVAPAPSVIYLTSSVCYPWPHGTRGPFLVVLVEVGTIQEVRVQDKRVKLLEAFGIDPNDMHVKLVFWEAFAEYVDDARDDLFSALADNPNQPYYVALEWAQAVLRHGEMQLHVTTLNNSHSPFPFIDQVDCKFVPFTSDGYANMQRQWSKLKSAAVETIMPSNTYRQQVIDL